MATTSAFSPSQMEQIYKRNPAWAPTQTGTTAQTPAATTQTPTTTTPNSATVTGGIDFSNIKPQFSFNLGNTSSSNSSHSGLNNTGQAALGRLLGSGDGNYGKLIDYDAARIANNYRLTGRDIIDQMNQVANQRASMGILGGTEAQNLRSNMLYQLMKGTIDKRAAAETEAMRLKAQQLPALLGLSNETDSYGSSKNQSFGYSQSPQDYQIIADMIRSGWTG